MRDKKTFRGYSEEQGYGFLRQAVCNYFKKRVSSYQTRRYLLVMGQRVTWEIS